MLHKRSSARKRALSTSAAILWLILLPHGAAPVWATPDPCEAALASPQEALTLQADSPVTVESAVAEWESEILKLQVSRPGLLSLSVESGPGAEGSLQAPGASGLRLVDRASLRPGRPLVVPVDPREVYCLGLSPQPGAGGPLRIRIELIDLCRLGPSPDDHGDSFACATEMHPGSHRAGSIGPGDRDVFVFSLATAETVEIRSEGAAGTAGQLFGEAGTLLAAADGGGLGAGFRISAPLPAGRYFLRVESANGVAGAYTLHVESVP